MTAAIRIRWNYSMFRHHFLSAYWHIAIYYISLISLILVTAIDTGDKRSDTAETGVK